MLQTIFANKRLRRGLRCFGNIYNMRLQTSTFAQGIVMVGKLRTDCRKLSYLLNKILVRPIAMIDINYSCHQIITTKLPSYFPSSVWNNVSFMRCPYLMLTGAMIRRDFSRSLREACFEEVWQCLSAGAR